MSEKRYNMEEEMLDIKLSKESTDTESVKDIKRIFLSEPAVYVKNEFTPRKIKSDEKIKSNVNYNDLCGPWIFPENPAHTQPSEPTVPSLCTWEIFTHKDIVFLRKYQRDRQAVLSYFENKFSRSPSFQDDKAVFIKVIWETFTFTKNNLFSEKGVSASLGLMHLTHRFFLSNPRRTVEETYKFFYDSLLLHAVLDPPKSDEVFSVKECEQLLEIFHKIYIENLPLLRLVCLPNYIITMNLDTAKWS